jgi:hypothetical protein
MARFGRGTGLAGRRAITRRSKRPAEGEGEMTEPKTGLASLELKDAVRLSLDAARHKEPAHGNSAGQPGRPQDPDLHGPRGNAGRCRCSHARR